VIRRRTGRRAGRVHPQPNRAASPQAGANRDPAGPGSSVGYGPPGQDRVRAENPAGGARRRRALQQDGGNLMPGAPSPQASGPVVARPAVASPHRGERPQPGALTGRAGQDPRLGDRLAS
jgi:hypothetical protein